MAGVEIACPSCGAETLLRREPVYEGLKKTGEKLMCSACGHEFPDEDSIPFTQDKQSTIFSEADKAPSLDIFSEEDKDRNCRHCKHYVVNPFTQRCGLHDKIVDATDVCFDFEEKKEETTEEDSAHESRE